MGLPGGERISAICWTVSDTMPECFRQIDRRPELLCFVRLKMMQFAMMQSVDWWLVSGQCQHIVYGYPVFINPLTPTVAISVQL